MEDLSEIVDRSEEYCAELQILAQNYMDMLRQSLWQPQPQAPLPKAVTAEILAELPSVTPQQTKKRIKRLSSLNESDEIKMPLSAKLSPRKTVRTSNSALLATANAMEEDQEVHPTPIPAPRQMTEQPVARETSEAPVTVVTEDVLMPPPPVPTAVVPSSVEQADNKNIESTYTRPKRAAKLKSEKNLKEPKLNQKMRRPSNFDNSKVKLEHEQRPSQMLVAPLSETLSTNTSIANPTVASARDTSKSSLASIRSEDSVIAVPTKAPSVVDLNSEDEQPQENGKSNGEMNDDRTRKCVIKVKREKLSVGSDEQRRSEEEQKEVASEEATTTLQDTDATPKAVPMPKVTVKHEAASDVSTIASSTLSVSTTKRGKKKKLGAHKPIKVERFSEIEKPVSTRTRKGAARPSGASVYEDAVDHMPLAEATNTPPSRVSLVPPHVAIAAGMNETVTVSSTGKPNTTMVVGVAPNDATFCANMAQDVGQATFVMDNQSANATVTMEKKIGDATFNVTVNSGAARDVQSSMASSQHSMETAKDTTHPQQDSLITEDESFEPEKPEKPISKLPNPKAIGLVKLPTSAKTFKMPTRTNELFNPLVQSPVKKKVEAFENAAIAAISTELTKSGRPKRNKENTTQSSTITPLIGKLTAPSLGRFLTPTQASNLTPSALGNVKKGPNSASKAMAFPKAITSVKSGSSTNSGKLLARENSAEDFRKGLHSLAEERKKQREQKHQLAAQQREAKERERAERMVKLTKEREEKRLKKQQEAEQKKRALEEIQRNLRQQEEAEAAKLKSAKAKAITEQERELLQQTKQQASRAAAKMLPPPPKLTSKYTFEMLHEDDSTDEEEKTTYKRPPPPTWSRSHVRGTAIRVQQYWPTNIIDSFFSVQPMSPDLRLIFPNIGAHHLKRNSSAMWSTPPRYSELPKY